MFQSFFLSRLNALENRYLLLDASRSFANAQPLPQLSPDWVRHICQMEKTDGLLFGPLKQQDSAGKSMHPSFDVVIYNSDGSIAERSGNGLRIFAYYLKKHFFFAEKLRQIQLQTYGFSAEGLTLLSESRAEFFETEIAIHLSMPRIQFRSAPNGHIESSTWERISRGFWVELAGAERVPVALNRDRHGKRKIAEVFRVDMGNPHCVLLCEKKDFSTRWADQLIRQVGCFFETLSCFPNKSNVQFVCPVTTKEIEVHVWERGSGYTLSSGTSAAAAFFACRFRNLVEERVVARMAGGDLHVAVHGNGQSQGISVQGPVIPEYLNREFLFPLEKVCVC